MSLSNVNIGTINTIPILSVASGFSYTFEIPENSRVQILWAQLLTVADATVGVRRPIMRVADETGATVFQITYFATQAANSSVFITYAQGVTIIPSTVLGTITTIPADGLFVRNNWELSFFPFPLISVGDVFTGSFQTRGLHNSAAPN